MNPAVSFKGDSLKTRLLFESDNPWGFPTLPHVPSATAPQGLIAYRTDLRDSQQRQSLAVHLFLNDIRIESVWTHPPQALQYLRKYPVALSPDFSFYPDYPLSLQLWNVYRNRWVAAYWLSQGLRVIPSVGWGDAASFAWCFAGLPRHSLLAVSTLGSKRDLADRLFFQRGFEKLLEILEPSQILCFGRPFPFMENLPLLRYPYEFCRKREQGKEAYNGIQTLQTKKRLSHSSPTEATIFE